MNAVFDGTDFALPEIGAFRDACSGHRSVQVGMIQSVSDGSVVAYSQEPDPLSSRLVSVASRDVIIIH